MALHALFERSALLGKRPAVPLGSSHSSIHKDVRCLSLRRFACPLLGDMQVGRRAVSVLGFNAYCGLIYTSLRLLPWCGAG